MYSYNVDCILVTYHPDILLLNRVLDGILFQIRNCYVINNGVQYFCYSTNNITIVNLGRNYGIAYAQNYGIELAKRHNADFVLLSDQDTIYPEDFISKMLDVYEHTEDKEHIGAITPIFYDKNKDRSSAIMATKFYSIIPESHKIYTVAHTISSGSLIPMENLKIIGFMREELFIDYVDTEWYWRALKYGYKILSIPAVAIKHELGDTTKTIGNRRIAIRNRVRYYYMIRNGIYIIIHTGLLENYEIILFLRELFIKVIGICLIEKKALPLIYKAIRDGIVGNMYEVKSPV